MLPTIAMTDIVDFLTELLNTPSPTGDAKRGITYCQQAFARFGDQLTLTIETTHKGMLLITIEGDNSDAPRGVTAHVDTLGAMVQEIKRNGRLKMTQLGGYPWTAVEGEGVTIFASNGDTYYGTILPIAASIHANTRAQRNETRSGDNMEVRIDARTDSRADTEALGIRVGDIIAFDPRVVVHDNGFIRSRHLDDKAGVAVMYGALAALAAEGKRPSQTTIFHISNYEEVGHGAAAGIPADMVDLLTIDMAVVAPKQTSDEFSVTICAKDSAGPYHMGFRRELENLAQSHDIPYHTDIYPYYGSDGESYWRAGGNVRVGLIGPGVDASHHYERTHTDSLAASTKLLLAYLLS